jgi:ADP-ribose pyrophosphatase YjhB (NUDIX family)
VIPCVGAVIRDSDGRLLLVKRGHQPERGRWSVPGGRVEPGESDQEAVIREIREETGLLVTPGPLIGRLRRPAAVPGAELDIRDYAATVVGGQLTAGDDADDVMWAGLGDLDSLPLTDGLLAALRGWGAI